MYKRQILYNNIWWYVKDGKVEFGYTGMAPKPTGELCYVKNGQMDTSYNGLVQYNGAWYYVKKGQVDTSYTNLYYHTDKNWYYLQNGKADMKTTCLVYYNGQWYYVRNSKIDWSYTCLLYTSVVFATVYGIILIILKENFVWNIVEEIWKKIRWKN